MVLFDKSNNNTIHHNSFVDNTEQCTNDNWINNQWYDSKTNEGNYWSDYNGTGDYIIGGSAGARDPFPLDHPLAILSSVEPSSTTVPGLGSFSLLVAVIFLILWHKRKK